MITAQKEFKKDPASMARYIQSNKFSAIFKRTSKQAKLLHWKKFCSSLNSQTNPMVIWRKIKMLKNSNSTIPHPTPSDKNWETEFLDRIAPENQHQSQPLDWHALHGTRISPERSYYDKPFTRTELDLALATANIKATPGPDNISYAMLVHLPDQAKDTLVSIFNELMDKNHCPPDWKQAWLKPILKSGQKPGDEKSYRPILYTSCVSKLFEKILKRRITAFVEQNHILPNSQHGFRKGKNVQMCLAELATSVNLSFSKKQMHFALMVDIKGAFDNVPHRDLLEELFFIGLPQS